MTDEIPPVSPGDKIGDDHGITAVVNWLQKQPGMPQRDAKYDPAKPGTWPWPERLERTLKILAAEHDANVVSPPNPPDPPDPPDERRYAPRTHNTTDRADARFCMKEEYGVVRSGSGYVDQMGVTYDEGGLDLGGRSKDIVPGLKGADSMDGLEPCDPYTHDGRTFPPYPAESFNK